MGAAWHGRNEEKEVCGEESGQKGIEKEMDWANLRTYYLGCSLGAETNRFSFNFRHCLFSSTQAALTALNFTIIQFRKSQTATAILLVSWLDTTPHTHTYVHTYQFWNICPFISRKQAHSVCWQPFSSFSTEVTCIPAQCTQPHHLNNMQWLVFEW